jgi:hypothetical protein
MKFYGGDAAWFVQQLTRPKLVQQGVLADAALAAAIQAERRQRERNDRRKRWLALTGELLRKDGDHEHCT